jgi:hypothetical protein
MSTSSLVILGFVAWYCDRPMARIGRVGEGAAVHSWSRDSLYSVRPARPDNVVARN